MSYNKAIEEISVIIPTYNRCDLLKRAINSVIKQTITPKEIIIVDNGSTDQTYQMVSSLFPEINYFIEKKRGVSAARNKGILESKSKWIAFLDSDDAWKPTKLEKQMEYSVFNQDKYRIIHTDENWYRNKKFLNQLKKHKKSGGNIFKNSLQLCCISPSSVVLKKQIFDDYGLFDENLEVCEDYDMWIRITAKEEVGFLDSPLVLKYGGHSDQLSKKFWGMDRFRIKSLEKNLKNEHFSKSQKINVLDTLIEKLTIVSDGALKRGNKEIFKKYNGKLQDWSIELDKLKK
ncbi:MAG: glycosyl transferase [SAR116 cluster bacterium]|nr:glycosyl transferase [SAR116 cluster bacterium]|tara:strand:- start:308 stop:1174 length:867 start_codon:yes stop_codon:yes gene_type:complete